MSDEQKIDENDLRKAFETLQELAKGHSSRGTNTTAVESMSGVSGSPQIHHTPSNSDPNGWAGSQARDAKENGASDAISDNGTDYDGGAEMVKSIMEKLSQGQQLTPAEYGFMEKAMPAFLKKDDDAKKAMDYKEDAKKAMDYKEDDDDVKKSLADEAASNETVANGMEISDFLAELVGTLNKSLSNMESRLRSDFQFAIASSDNRQEVFGKSLAGALGTISEGLVAQTQRVNQIEATPARGPKSNDVPEPFSKSFAGPDGETLSKGDIATIMVDMVEQKKLNPQAVIRFESNGGQIDENLLARVHAHRAGR